MSKKNKINLVAAEDEGRRGKKNAFLILSAINEKDQKEMAG